MSQRGPGQPETDVVARGTIAQLRRHRLADSDAFVRWYGDPDIAVLLRHDLRPLSAPQARTYFRSIILPASAAGTAWAIQDAASGNLLGTTGVLDIRERDGSCLFRIVIGEKQAWGHGFGTDATRLVVGEVFHSLGLRTVRLEVFAHNTRAIRAYQKVGFQEVRRSVEWARTTRLDIIEMHLSRDDWHAS